LVLDTRDLEIEGVTYEGGAGRFVLGERDSILGSALTIELPRGADCVEIRYATRPEASGEISGPRAADIIP